MTEIKTYQEQVIELSKTIGRIEAVIDIFEKRASDSETKKLIEELRKIIKNA